MTSSQTVVETEMPDLQNPNQESAAQLVSPAMLAEILGVSARTIRRLHREGLLEASQVVMNLPQFSFEQVNAARQLVKWIQQGTSIQSIGRQVAALRERYHATEPLAELPIVAHGKRLVWHGEGELIEAGGQICFEFEQAGNEAPVASEPEIIQFRAPVESEANSELGAHPAGSLAEMVAAAIQAEDDGQLEIAVDWYRAALAAHGANADLCFQLAELLYRRGDLAGARERYFIALELDPNLVEARANLGCVLAENGEVELAIAAFEGALEQFPDYADVHFQLARALDDAGHTTRAAEHWQRFLLLAPSSPWADEAHERLQQTGPILEF